MRAHGQERKRKGTSGWGIFQPLQDSTSIRTKLVAKAQVEANDGGIVDELLLARILRVDEHWAQRVEKGLHEDKEELAGHRVEPVALKRRGNVDLGEQEGNVIRNMEE
jgi:hypothetical protein